MMLRHGHIELALHRLRDGDGRPLLLLHGLGERTPTAPPRWVGDWPGPIHGLDFTGHGASTVPRGGGYTAEMLLGDADAALSALGEATVVGRGLGGYIGLLLAGARAGRVHGVLIDDGPGLTGGGDRPGSPFVVVPQFATGSTPDPFALVELGRDLRPPDYALDFVRFALEGSPVDDPIVVTAVVRPEWLAAVVEHPGVRTAERSDRAAALASFGRYQVGS